MAGLVATCAGPDGDDVLATIDDVAITSSDLSLFENTLPDYLLPEGGAAAERELQQTLVDRQILILEAEELGYANEPEIRKRLHRYLIERVTNRVLERELDVGRDISEEEIATAYRDEGWDRRLWPAHIVTASRPEAEAVLAELRDGADFAELAIERSLAMDGIRGGDMMQPYGPGDGSPQLFDAALSLSLGEYSEPVRTAEGIEIVRVLEIEEVPFEEVRPRLESALRRRKFRTAYEGYLRSLEVRFEVEYDSAAIAALMRPGHSDESDAIAEADSPIVTYGEGRIVPLSHARRILGGRGLSASALKDTGSAVSALRRWVMADTLFVLQATAEGWRDTPEFIADTRRRYRKLLVGQLLRRHVLQRVTISEADVRSSFEAEPDSFRSRGLERAKPILLHKLKAAKSRRAVDAYIAELRSKYDDRIEWRPRRRRARVVDARSSGA